MAVSVRVDGVMVVAGLALAGAAFLYWKRDAIAAALDPTRESNLAHQAATKAINAVTDGGYESVGDWAWATRDYNPLAWVFEGIGRVTGDIQ